MSIIQVLVLGNSSYAQRLSDELSEHSIEHRIDEISDPEAFYDVCISTADEPTFDQAKRAKSKRIFVFNGVEISNSALKNMVRMRINGFLEDHSNPTPIVDLVKRLYRTKTTCLRLSDKIAMLCA